MITWEEIFRYVLDQEISGRPVRSVNTTNIQQRIEDSAIELIERHNLMDVFLVDLGLYELIQIRKNQKVAKR